MERQLYLQNGIPCHMGKNVSRFFHCETWQKLWFLRKTKSYRIEFTIWAYILLAHDKNWSFPSLYHIYFIIQFINPQRWNNVRTTLSLQRCKIQRWINVETSTLKSLTLKQRWSLVDQRNIFHRCFNVEVPARGDFLYFCRQVFIDCLPYIFYYIIIWWSRRAFDTFRTLCCFHILFH